MEIAQYKLEVEAAYKDKVSGKGRKEGKGKRRGVGGEGTLIKAHCSI